MILASMAMVASFRGRYVLAISHSEVGLEKVKKLAPRPDQRSNL